MSTFISFTIDDLDAEIKAQNSRWTNRSDFTTLRERAYDRALSEYTASLVAADDAFIKSNTLAAPIVLGTALITTTTYAIYQVAMPTDGTTVAGDAILVQKSATAEFFSIPRKAFADIVPGTDAYAFWENNGVINIYTTAADFDSTASAAFDYYRKLDATQTTGTALDIKEPDFGTLVDTTASFLANYL